jgi:hypothetical protein
VSQAQVEDSIHAPATSQPQRTHLLYCTALLGARQSPRCTALYCAALRCTALHCRAPTSLHAALQDILVGLLRLRRVAGADAQRQPELRGRCSIVRELHVYGTAVAVHARDTSLHQHQVSGQGQG